MYFTVFLRVKSLLPLCLALKTHGTSHMFLDLALRNTFSNTLKDFGFNFTSSMFLLLNRRNLRTSLLHFYRVRVVCMYVSEVALRETILLERGWLPMPPPAMYLNTTTTLYPFEFSMIVRDNYGWML